MSPKLKIFECRRGREEWQGALIVGAETINEATSICTEILQKQESIEKPYTVKELLLKKGLIYDDKLR